MALTLAQCRALLGQWVTWTHPTDATRPEERGVLTAADTHHPGLVTVLYEGQSVAQYTDPKTLRVEPT